jgi:hypothetical protein
MTTMKTPPPQSLNQALAQAAEHLQQQLPPQIVAERVLAHDPYALNTSLNTSLSTALAQAREQLSAAEPPAYVQAQLLAAFERGKSDRTHRAHRADSVATLTHGGKTAIATGGGRGWFAGAVLGRLGSAFTLRAASVASGAAALVLITLWLVLPMGGTGMGTEGSDVVAQATEQAAVSTPFMPLVSADRMAAEVDGWLMTTELPRTALAGLGLPYDPSRAAETVRTELLLSSAGEVLAVRLMN